MSVVIDLQRQRTSLASQCAGYDCPAFPVLFNNDTCFLISGVISYAYGLQRHVILKEKVMVVAANVFTLFCSYAWIFGYSQYVAQSKICIL